MKTVCLLSGGIDSPVAAYMAGKNGCEVVLLHMDNRPYSDDSNYEKAFDLKKDWKKSSAGAFHYTWLRMEPARSPSRTNAKEIFNV